MQGNGGYTASILHFHLGTQLDYLLLDDDIQWNELFLLRVKVVSVEFWKSAFM